MTGDIGKLYSQALFELGLELGNNDEIHKDLNECRKIFDDYPDFAKILASPSILSVEKHEIADKVFGKEGTVHDFICLVTDHNRVNCFGKITDEYNKLYNEHNNITQMTVITSVPLKAEAKERLLRKLEEKSGKTVELTEKVDPSLIGGIVLRTKDTLIDNSIKGRLEAVAKQLKA